MLVTYGSLYPWVFRANPQIANPFLALLHAHSDEFSRRFIADIVINLGLYVPVGMSAWLAFRRCRPALLRGGLAILLGFALSAAIETLQFYVPGRRSSVIDLINNTVGTGMGIAAAVALEDFMQRRRRSASSRGFDRATLALLLTWMGSLLFPLFPVMWLLLYREKAAIFLHPRAFNAVLFCSAAASWYTAARMLRTISAPNILIWATVALVPAQFLIMGRQPSPAELVGALAGLVLFATVGRVRAAAWLFVAVLLARGLQPFHTGALHAFEFTPFGALLAMNWEIGTRILLEKSWYFGAAIWLLTEAGTRFGRSVAVVVSLAAVVEVIQIWLPGRTPETTDPILALLIGLAIHSLRD